MKGKFEKRLKPFADRIIGDNNLIQIGEVLKLIDEARREFPNTPKQKPNRRYDHTLQEYLQWLNEDRKEWFKKWFSNES